MSEKKKISRKDIIGLCEFLKIHHFENAYTLFEYTEGLEQKVEQLENIRKEAITYILAHCEIIRHKKENVDEIGRVNGGDLLNILNRGYNND